MKDQIESLEQKLHEKFVNASDIKILEITRSEREVLICDQEGTIIAMRKYARHSPVDRVIELLCQLLQGEDYGRA